MQRFTLLFTLAVLISGCSLEDVVDKVLVCEDGVEYLSDNQCVKNTEEHCGSEGNNCLERFGWKEAECQTGKCVALDSDLPMELKDGNCVYAQCPGAEGECDSGYRMYSLACVPIDHCCGDSCQNCAAYGQVCNAKTCVKK